LTDTWRETIKQMQIFYSNIKTKGGQGVTRNERQEMKNALIDYGALQPDTDSAPVEEEEPPTALQNRESSPPPDVVELAPPVPLRTTQEDFLSMDFDMFDTEFNIDDADLEAAIADATQGFWANFPGEMEIY
jgi:hypothetical protein